MCSLFLYLLCLEWGGVLRLHSTTNYLRLGCWNRGGVFQAWGDRRLYDVDSEERNSGYKYCVLVHCMSVRGGSIVLDLAACYGWIQVKLTWTLCKHISLTLLLCADLYVWPLERSMWVDTELQQVMGPVDDSFIINHSLEWPPTSH